MVSATTRPVEASSSTHPNSTSNAPMATSATKNPPAHTSARRIGACGGVRRRTATTSPTISNPSTEVMARWANSTAVAPSADQGMM